MQIKFAVTETGNLSLVSSFNNVDIMLRTSVYHGRQKSYPLKLSAVFLNSQQYLLSMFLVFGLFFCNYLEFSCDILLGHD